MAIELGCLLLADISGYTKYLTGVELDHSQDILADLLSTVVGQLTGALHLAKLEGDAVFCYGSDGDGDLSGAALITLVEGCYIAFEERVRNIKNLTTCDCNACILIPSLTLKFLVHHGQYVIHEVMGNRELVGSDVILAHRLLKNTVTEETGLRGYALFTRASADLYGVEADAAGMTAHQEAYEDVGRIEGFVLDLESRWRDEQDRRSVYVGPEDALIETIGEVPAAPQVAWESLTSPGARLRWQPGVTSFDQENPAGAPGVGTTNHCVHGDVEVTEEILDWKPFRYHTLRSKSPMGVGLFTFELVPLEGGGTRVISRMRPEDPNSPPPTPDQFELFRQM
ncbi:MAG TPA: DUF2652 domain-containing protein, partial [Actinomycetota bacterium]